MSTRAGFFRTTNQYALTSEAGSFEVPGTITQVFGGSSSGANKAYYVAASEPCHLSRTGTADQTSLYLPANCPVVFECVAGESISFVLDAGGETGGYVWFSVIDHT